MRRWPLPVAAAALLATAAATNPSKAHFERAARAYINERIGVWPGDAHPRASVPALHTSFWCWLAPCSACMPPPCRFSLPGLRVTVTLLCKNLLHPLIVPTSEHPSYDGPHAESVSAGLAARWALRGPAWLGGVRYWNCWVCSFACSQRVCFAGAFGTWLPLPAGRLAFLAPWLMRRLRVCARGAPCWSESCVLSPRLASRGVEGGVCGLLRARDIRLPQLRLLLCRMSGAACCH